MNLLWPLTVLLAVLSYNYRVIFSNRNCQQFTLPYTVVTYISFTSCLINPIVYRYLLIDFICTYQVFSFQSLKFRRLVVIWFTQTFLEATLPGQFIGQSLMYSPTAPRFATILSSSSLSSDGLSEELKLSTSSDTDCIAGKLLVIVYFMFD